MNTASTAITTALPIKEGAKVYHPLFGKGTVRAVTPQSSNPTADTTIVAIHFPEYNIGVREFIWGLAKAEFTLYAKE